MEPKIYQHTPDVIATVGGWTCTRCTLRARLLFALLDAHDALPIEVHALYSCRTHGGAHYGAQPMGDCVLRENYGAITGTTYLRGIDCVWERVS
jgi:hypothetical protein